MGRYLGMPKIAKELSAIEVKRIKTPGMHFVGGVAGLALQLKNSEAASWILRVRIGGQRKHIGLGGFPQVTLAEARGAAKNQLTLINSGIDPIAKKKIDKSRLKAEAAKAKTFKDCAQEYLQKHQSSYSNAKHAKQWASTLETYAYPIIGNLLVSDLNRKDILDVLEQPIKDQQTNKKIGTFWAARTETASRVQNRIKSIIDFAIVAEYRDKINPATWSGYLDTQLPQPNKISTVRHHPAVPYSEVGDFIFALRSHKSISARALEFLILTGVRSGSVRLAHWDEINFDNALWTIPAAHTKTRQIHRVPLTKQSIKLLRELPKIKGQTHIFPSARGKALSDMALSKLMKDMRKRNEFKTDAVPHGFRSTFRDWAADQTNYPDELRKIASGHKVGDSVLQSYQRTDLLDKRRRLMTDWANFLDKHSVSKSPKVVQIRKKA